MYQAILEHAAALFDVPLDELRGPSRAQHVNQARQAAAYALRHTTPLSFAQIARLIGRRDHTTVMYAVEAAERRAVRSPAYALNLAALRGGV